ncbi:hypothetical protein ABZW10_33090 [Kitasatospora sp. NPDC004723]|uniref:hypothetical protein n=1 Tax=Kitasatospora sp. NPDC004723 TaxID=3154288 RepID=UPI0033BF5B7E
MTAAGDRPERLPVRRAGALMSGMDGHPWPALVHGRPAVLVPRRRDAVERLVDAADGWGAYLGGLSTPCEEWAAQLDGARLVARRPGGEVWLDEQLLLSAEWRRGALAHGAVLLVTGEFGNAAEVVGAALAGSLRVLAAPLRFTGRPVD